MTEDQKNKKLLYLRSQRENPTGNYRKYLVNTFNYIFNDSKLNGTGWSRAAIRDMINFVYDGNPDHMAFKMINEYKKTLKDLGYIRYIKENNEWRTYIQKELDF
ncbi:hypothetical protein D7Z26_06665 [Cohnella endophytica]|uniref:Uncharacterized protein n=1 Tax=Cohnella endophytica TaxID=2419778 RepID=A0A494Y4S0_9BACL|nr:hypothetical protein [Cohnella endophytica]RKP54920.1 hypothetical protein D7Z26_06665 [Cohnella endophytica]